MSLVCIEHRYIDQMGMTPCPECEEIRKEALE
jgi:hypothetical protein